MCTEYEKYLIDNWLKKNEPSIVIDDKEEMVHISYTKTSHD